MFTVRCEPFETDGIAYTYMLGNVRVDQLVLIARAFNRLTQNIDKNFND
jgi:hypothetical protein